MEDYIQKVFCTTCGWKGADTDCLNWDGQLCCPECAEPIIFEEDEQ